MSIRAWQTLYDSAHFAYWRHNCLVESFECCIILEKPNPRSRRDSCIITLGWPAGIEHCDSVQPGGSVLPKISTKYCNAVVSLLCSNLCIQLWGPAAMLWQLWQPQPVQSSRDLTGLSHALGKVPCKKARLA